LPSAISDTTKVNPVSQQPIMLPELHHSEHVKICIATATGSSGDTPYVTMRSDGAGFPEGMQGVQPQGEPHGESSYVSTDDDNADTDFEPQALVYSACEDVEEALKMLHEVQSHPDWP
jgi:hypothetical protein